MAAERATGARSRSTGLRRPPELDADSAVEAGDCPGAAQLSCVALADVPARSGRRAAFLPQPRTLVVAAIAALLLAVPSITVGAVPATVGEGPVSSAGPTITGTATQGSRLTATSGSWRGSGTIRYVYQWFRCDTMGSRCGRLRGATAPHHTLVANDVGHTLAINVRATDSRGSTNAYASLIGPIAGLRTPLASIVQPVVSGAATLGGNVHVDTGTWRRPPKSFAYQWIRCNSNGRACAPILGDTGASHTIVRRDVAHALVAIVQARAGATARAVLSRATARIASTAPPSEGAPAPGTAAGPLATVLPSIGTAVKQGKQLQAVAGTWTGSGAIQYAYQWYRCDPGGAHCKSIRGATKPTYTQVAKDVANTVGLAVRATDANGTTSAYSSLVGPVAAARSALYSTAQPTISGTPTPGQALQVNPGSWNQTPTAYAYQWQRCNANGRLCAAIPNATAAAYTVTGDDSGHTVLAVVQATAAGVSQGAWSGRSYVNAAPTGPAATARPAVTGVAREGTQLTGAAGTWTGSGTIQYAYQWYRCDPAGAHCKSVHGATKPTYTLVAKDVANTVGLTVRATDASGTTSAYSSLVGPVAAARSALYSTAQPTISGTPTPGQALQVNPGSWNQAPTAYAYQWQRCNANGRLCAAIPNATAAAYTVTADDTGHTILAVVEAKAGGITQPVVSVGTVAA
jgi:hypothetical protein